MLRHMTLAEMTAVSGQMVDKTTRRETFLSIPEVAPLHPLLTAAHNSVLGAQPVDPAASPAMLAILKKEGTLDIRHDHLARAGTATLEHEREHCLAAEVPDEARAAMCDRVISQIYPDGLACINVSLAAEAGNTARVEKLLEDQPQIGQFLATIAVPGTKPGPKKGERVNKTLLDTMHEWIAVGREIQKLEEQREDLLAKETKVSPAAPKTILAARAQWIRIVSAVLNNLDLSQAPAETIEAIRGPILAASDRAGKRYAASNGAGAADNASQEEDTAPGPKPEKAQPSDATDPTPVNAPQ